MVEMAQPEPQHGQVLVQAIRTGVCGTDREMTLRRIVDAPPGEDFLVLGHEGFGRIVAVRGDVGNYRVGDLVVPVVRRGCGECNACNTDNADMCFTGKYAERGIHKQHGFFSEYYADFPRYLAKASPDIEDVAVLGEPMSVSVKATGWALSFQERVRFNGAYSQQGKHENVLIAGHGPIGLLATFLFLANTDFNVYVLGRRPKGDPIVAYVEDIGARYLNSENGEIEDFVKSYGGFFVIFEATGLSALTFKLAQYLGRNGVMILTGVPRVSQTIEIDGDAIMASLVRYNQAIIGSVNACRGCFQDSLKQLARFKEIWGEKFTRIITSRYKLRDYKEAFGGKRPDDIKTVIEF